MLASPSVLSASRSTFQRHVDASFCLMPKRSLAMVHMEFPYSKVQMVAKLSKEIYNLKC